MSSWQDGLKSFVSQEVGCQVVTCDIGLLNPGDSQVEAAFCHSRRLGV